MNYNFELDIPNMNDEVGEKELEMNMTYGVITHVSIAIPRGHAGLAHLKIFYHESQLYPLNRDGNYHGDRMDVTFDEFQPILAAPFMLKAKGWNEDTENDHVFIMNFTLLRPEELERSIPDVSIKAMQDLLGLVGEV